MVDSEPDAVLRPLSSAAARATPWASALEILGGGEVFWFSTTRPGGRPHVTPLPAAWSLDGMCFGLYRVAPTVGFAFGELPTSSQTCYAWPGR
ncbi:hypothetical protein [Streptomyces chartreusis]|uniref:hypothetical protein n=1 Tax=Streptomyces chartreusis TaxID=1969 RepID=UPI0034106895